jgi:hypothetical protein
MMCETRSVNSRSEPFDKYFCTFSVVEYDGKVYISSNFQLIPCFLKPPQRISGGIFGENLVQLYAS